MVHNTKASAHWGLLPGIAGFFLALWVDHLIPATEFKHLMGACLAVVMGVMLWSQWKGKENLLTIISVLVMLLV